MMSLQGKVILITGASKGIGKASAERVAKEGASVVINYNNDAASADALVQSIGNDRAIAVQADVSKISDIARLVEAAVTKFGRIDVIMANAALMLMRTTEDTTEKDFDEMFDLNVKGPYFLVQKAIPHMPPGSRVILVSTSVCHFSQVQPNYLLYAATKGAIEQMTRVMAKGLALKSITVNAVGPGPTGTELFFRGKTDGLVNTIKGMSPFGRLGQPEEIAGMVSFLAGSDSSWVAGQTLLVNGATTV
jgi:3-oxoacyl-[acyl-carrier protein] reductase